MERKLIETFPNYEISDDGRVFNILTKREKVFAHRIRSGYYYVALFNNKIEKSVAVHRLVAQAFIPNIQNKPCVNHKNGNKLDNRAENLEWTTWSENKIHADLKGLSNLKPVKQYTIDGKFVNRFRTMTEASNLMGIKISNISECCRKNRHKAGGFMWKYSNDITKNNKHVKGIKK